MPNNIQPDQKPITSGSLRKIGNYLGLREEIDRNHKVTNLIRANLSVVDLIPVDYALRFSYITENNTDFAIAYDFETPAKGYSDRCELYKLERANGLQLWLTDDTQAYEEFSNSFENNLIETKLNEMGNWGQQLQSMVRTFSPNSSLNQFIDASGQFVTKVSNGILGTLGVKEDAIGNALGNTAHTAAGMILQGKQISLPKIWRQSDYNPSVTFNVKLISPYGDFQSIKNFIIAPLIYILLLSAPQSTDGLTYGLYQPIKIKSYGITNINLGAITSISLRRGGRESSYNIYKQPLQIDVGINCIPLSGGFAYMHGPRDTADMSDADKPYEENANGSPAFTTIGNVIQSLRPAPREVIGNISNSTSASVQYQSRPDNLSWPSRSNDEQARKALAQQMQDGHNTYVQQQKEAGNTT